MLKDYWSDCEKQWNLHIISMTEVFNPHSVLHYCDITIIIRLHDMWHEWSYIPTNSVFDAFPNNLFVTFHYSLMSDYLWSCFLFSLCLCFAYIILFNFCHFFLCTLLYSCYKKPSSSTDNYCVNFIHCGQNSGWYKLTLQYSLAISNSPFSKYICQTSLQKKVVLQYQQGIFMANDTPSSSSSYANRFSIFMWCVLWTRLLNFFVKDKSRIYHERLQAAWQAEEAAVAFNSNGERRVTWKHHISRNSTVYIWGQNKNEWEFLSWYYVRLSIIFSLSLLNLSSHYSSLLLWCF